MPVNCLNLNSAVEIANARNIVIRKWLQHTSTTAPPLNLRRTAVFRLKGTRFDHFWDMGPKEKLKSGKQKVEIPMKSSKGHFCSHFPCIWRGYRRLAGNTLPRERIPFDETFALSGPAPKAFGAGATWTVALPIFY